MLMAVLQRTPDTSQSSFVARPKLSTTSSSNCRTLFKWAEHLMGLTPDNSRVVSYSNNLVLDRRQHRAGHLQRSA
jgi:hypothetical protein